MTKYVALTHIAAVSLHIHEAEMSAEIAEKLATHAGELAQACEAVTGDSYSPVTEPLAKAARLAATLADGASRKARIAVDSVGGILYSTATNKPKASELLEYARDAEHAAMLAAGALDDANMAKDIAEACLHAADEAIQESVRVADK